jgi:hypothetical protein
MTRCGKRLFGAVFELKQPNIYQDRLGTNVGKLRKTVFLAGRAQPQGGWRKVDEGRYDWVRTPVWPGFFNLSFWVCVPSLSWQIVD